MSNHPNRSKSSLARNPTPAEVCAARAAAGLTQKEAAALIFCSWRTWQDWEAGVRRMHPAFWLCWRMVRGLK
jgi:DNA-binding transcriptional regulator YiaG